MLTIYKASAGSGKTYTLAYEYIKLLLGVRIQDEDRAYYVLNHKTYLKGKAVNRYAHRRILAITFTNKATSEMKERIIKQLEALTHLPGTDGKDADYAQALMKEFGCLREELRDVAEDSLRSLLNDYGQFNVSTIDAFFQTILRGFAREIDRQGDYRLELDESTVISQAISMLFDELNSPARSREADSTEKWLEKIAMQRVVTGDDFNPFNSNSRMYRSIENNLKKVFNERFMSREKEMYDYLNDRSRLDRFENWLKNAIAEISSEEEATAMSVGVSEDMERYVAALINKIQQSGGLKDEAYDSVFKKGSATASKFLSHSGPLAKKNKVINEDLYFDWFDALVQLAFRRKRYEEMLDKINTLQAFVHIHKYIDRYRVENNLILISDTNALLSAIVSEDDTPFIYERVGVSLENFLIDEFQDTSRQQWRNLKPLVANSLGTDADSLIIGDVKQSIYRWRGGDSVLLASEVQTCDFPDNNTVRGSRDGENTNYRSAHSLVRFNNSLFNEIACHEHVDGYEGVAQSLGKTMEGVSGYIRILDLTGDKYEAVATKLLGPEFLENANAENRKIKASDVSLKLLCESIMEQVRRGYRFDEIAILCRDHASLVAVAEYIVKEYPEIKLVSDEALLLCNSNAVKMIISMLEIIDKSFGARDTGGTSSSQADDAGGTDIKVLGQSMRMIDSEAEEARLRRTALRRRRAMLIDSFNYYMAHGKTVEEALPLAIENSKRAVIDDTEEESSAGNERDLERDLDEIRRIAPSTLSAMVEAIISVKLTEEQRSEEMPYLTAFVDMVEAFSRDSIPSIHSFLNYWRENERKFAIAAGENIDAVSILTVHKAKGLEWPCVHLPLMKWMLEDTPDAEWLDMSVCTEIPADIRPPMMYLEPKESFRAEGCAFAPQLAAEAEELKGDNLNVAYVAFTRAVRELEVHLIDSNDKRRHGKTMALAIKEALSRRSDGATDGIFLDLTANVDDTGNYILGEPTVPLRKAVSAPGDTVKSPVFHVSFNPLNSQLTRLADLTTPGDTPDDPDTGDELFEREIVDEPVEPGMEDAVRHGLILHSILAQMYTLNDIDSAIEYHRRDIADSELAVYRHELECAFRNGGAMVARWFSPDNRRVLNEQSIYCATDNSNRRADRIIWTADGIVEVVDYKFTSTERDSHLRQVREYAMMLRDMGEAPVHAYLWYPLLGRIVEVEGPAI